MGTPLKGALSAGGVGKNHNFGRIAGYRSMTGGVQTTTATVHRTVYCTDDHASVSQWPCLSQPAWTTMTKRTDLNCTQR